MIIRQNTNAIQQLLDMKEVLKDPQNWLKGKWASSNGEDDLDPHNPEASKFCLMGAGLHCSDLDLDGGLAKYHPRLVSYPYIFAASLWLWGQVEDNAYINSTRINDPSEVNDWCQTTYEGIIKLINYALALAVAERFPEAKVNEPVENDLGPLEGAEYEERVEEPVCV